MGSCISKFNSNKKNQEEHIESIVQDKLVISQAPISISTPPPVPETPKPPYPSPLSPTSSISASSFSSFYCATSTNSTSSSNVSLSSSSSSLSSSIICPKERSTFSNDYLRSCVKENPQVIKGKIDRFCDQTPRPNKTCNTKLRNNISTQGKSIVASPRECNKPKKRSRANSPNLTRQKSLRKEAPERASSTPSRIIRSPSPTRRFNSENYNYKATLMNQTQKYKRRPYDLKENSRLNYRATEKENVRSSPKNVSSTYVGVNRMNEEYASHHIGEELPVDHEDINNPHIALDCFIFL
ncbi:segmentation polarity homeobox protein engrailed [Heracleum sosnowskyi]|uniref:Segmentation polarity homeobox protein engrailed n=1 Tax=Heracleum sosnowskyi TaxID=360622 RepID=A0AAD8HPW9_9APIA|nr:segmentation polarity homeobox protein engrailed [Heracleum sosnowskyi]